MPTSGKLDFLHIKKFVQFLQISTFYAVALNVALISICLAFGACLICMLCKTALINLLATDKVNPGAINDSKPLLPCGAL